MIPVRSCTESELPRLVRWARGGGTAGESIVADPAVRERTAAFALDGGARPLAAAVVTEVRHPLDGAPEALVHSYRTTAGADTAALVARLLDWAAERELACVRVHLRSWPDPAFAEGWMQTHVRVAKRLDLDAAVAALRRSRVLIRRAGDEDLELLERGVAGSVRDSLMPFERARVDGERLRGWARVLLADLARDDAVALVAESGGEPLGYALADLAHRDELGADAGAWLHDTLVLEAGAGRGAGSALTAAVEMLAARAGRPVLGATVDRPDEQRSRLLLARLAGDGWTPCELTLAHPLEAT